MSKLRLGGRNNLILEVDFISNEVTYITMIHTSKIGYEVKGILKTNLKELKNLAHMILNQKD